MMVICKTVETTIKIKVDVFFQSMGDPMTEVVTEKNLFFFFFRIKQGY